MYLKCDAWKYVETRTQILLHYLFIFNPQCLCFLWFSKAAMLVHKQEGIQQSILVLRPSNINSIYPIKCGVLKSDMLHLVTRMLQQTVPLLLNLQFYSQYINSEELATGTS